MEYQGMQLHNITQLVYDERYNDYQLCRVPEWLRRRLNTKAQKKVMRSSGGG